MEARPVLFENDCLAHSPTAIPSSSPKAINRFSGQPLTILGVTGPFSVLAENIYSLCTTSFNIPFLPFMAWTLIHSAWLHYILAALNAHDWTMRYVTTFNTEIFSLLNSIIYFHKAIQELQRAHDALSFAAFLYAIIGAIGTMLVAIFLSTAERWTPLFHRYVRMGLTEYAAAISIIIFIGMPHVGELANLDRQTLQVSSQSFRPSDPDRTTFFVPLWQLPIGWVFAAIVPAMIITVLFFFDHEVSSIICTIDRYGTQKPGGFAWDIALLGTTTALCGILGIPPANGLLPQAPLHSESLLHTEKDEVSVSVDGDAKIEVREVRRVYEQRWSALLQASGIFIFISPPLQRVLGLTPTSVLAGLFLFMGEQSLAVKYVTSPLPFAFAPLTHTHTVSLSFSLSLPIFLTTSYHLPRPLSLANKSKSPILHRTLNILTPPSDLPPLPASVPSYLGIHMYTLTQIAITTVIFIVSLTKGAPAFPLLIIAFVPIRLLVAKRVWKRSTLRAVDRWACREGGPEEDDDDDDVEDVEDQGEVMVEMEMTGGRVSGEAGQRGRQVGRAVGSSDVDANVHADEENGDPKIAQ